MPAYAQGDAERLDPLRFKVAPHIVQDLGLNLYNSLPRVLVEFVANCYDADSPDALIMIDTDAINKARNVLRAKWKLEVENNGAEAAGDLDTRELPSNLQIVVLDRGHGMSRQDLQDKFLVAGRRRREEEPGRKGRTEKGRLLMGRKGLGKFAGFGVAHEVTVITRKEGENHATKMTLNYDELVKKARTDDVVIPDELMPDGGPINDKGTRIILSRLVYGPMKSHLETIAHAIADHFSDIDTGDFQVKVNDKPVEPELRNLVFAWPKPELPVTDLVIHELEEEDRPKVSFQYRIRFTGSGKHLNARDRGVRIYAHKRLAAAPDLLDVKTGIHGFRNTEYLDGVVHANFIDDQPAEYIATDRQTLRWESPLLEPLRAFLSDEMTRACNEYQKKRDADAEKAAPVHGFTKDLIQNAGLAKHRQKMAFAVAGRLASICEGGIDGEEYKTRLPIFVDGLSHGDVLKALGELAKQAKPEFHEVVAKTVQLSEQEFGDFMRFVQGRLNAIQSLQKICQDVDFKKAKNEKELHSLLEKNPWLIDPTFTQFLVSNEWVSTTLAKLAEELEIGGVADDDAEKDNKRPDLVFLLGNMSLDRVIIVELKAPNIPLTEEHLLQLRSYMRKTRQWLEAKGRPKVKVEGYLIGTMPDPGSKAAGAEMLREMIEKDSQKAEWHVYDLLELLERTNDAHKELLAIYQQAAKEDKF